MSGVTESMMLERALRSSSISASAALIWRRLRVLTWTLAVSMLALLSPLTERRAWSRLTVSPIPRTSFERGAVGIAEAMVANAAAKRMERKESILCKRMWDGVDKKKNCKSAFNEDNE